MKPARLPSVSRRRTRRARASPTSSCFRQRSRSGRCGSRGCRPSRGAASRRPRSGLAETAARFDEAASLDRHQATARSSAAVIGSTRTSRDEVSEQPVERVAPERSPAFVVEPVDVVTEPAGPLPETTRPSWRDDRHSAPGRSRRRSPVAGRAGEAASPDRRAFGRRERDRPARPRARASSGCRETRSSLPTGRSRRARRERRRGRPRSTAWPRRAAAPPCSRAGSRGASRRPRALSSFQRAKSFTPTVPLVVLSPTDDPQPGRAAPRRARGVRRSRPFERRPLEAVVEAQGDDVHAGATRSCADRPRHPSARSPAGRRGRPTRRTAPPLPASSSTSLPSIRSTG